MVTKVVHYVCEECFNSFDNQHEAEEHEKECDKE